MKSSIQHQEFSAYASVYDEDELKGFSHSITEIQWLLLSLTLLYFFIPNQPIVNHDTVVITLICYASFIIIFRYLNLIVHETRWKLAIETWVMIAFITFILCETGAIESPLLNLYLLVIITCAITMGKLMTLLEVGLIAACYLFIGHESYGFAIFSPESLTVLSAKFAPFLLVAYVTTMLAADVAKAKKKIALLSHTDDLTGLLNMRAFNLIMDKELASASRYNNPFTVLMIDIDGLKAINDQHGHMTGSRMIEAVANIIGVCVRSSDVLARYGGDEFVLLMPNTSVEDSRIVGERIRAAISNTSFEVNGNRVKTSVSIGIASFPDTVLQAGQVINKADAALYSSKQSGKNRVTYYDKDIDTQEAIYA